MVKNPLLFFLIWKNMKSKIRYILSINQNEITDQDEINKQIFSLYQSLFSRKVQFQTEKIETYLENILLPKLTNEQTLSCESIVSGDEVYKSLKSMENNKPPGNDGLSEEFYECFWDEIKKPFLASTHKVFLNKELSTSQKQTVIKMLKKRHKYKRFIKNYRPISLLNTYMKIISKALSTRIKSVLPFLISYNQTAYVKSKFISESGSVISDILEIANTLALEGFLVTTDIEQAFDSVNPRSYCKFFEYSDSGWILLVGLKRF